MLGGSQEFWKGAEIQFKTWVGILKGYEPTSIDSLSDFDLGHLGMLNEIPWSRKKVKEFLEMA